MLGRLRATLRLLPLRVWAATLLFGAVVLLLQFGLNMRRGLNHDEQQFVASGVLLARYGLRPYADFAYFHVPAQTLLYGLLFRFFDEFLLTARIVSVLAGWLSLALIYLLALAYAPFRGAWGRFGFGAALVLLLLATPLFVHTSGRAWNHDLPLLLALLGFVAMLQGLAADLPAPLGRVLAGPGRRLSRPRRRCPAELCLPGAGVRGGSLASAGLAGAAKRDGDAVAGARRPAGDTAGLDALAGVAPGILVRQCDLQPAPEPTLLQRR